MDYLGVYLGVDVGELMYDLPLHKYIKSVKLISSLDCGFSTSIALHKILAVSALSYVCSFIYPTKRVFEIEKWALQNSFVVPGTPSLRVPSCTSVTSDFPIKLNRWISWQSLP